MHSISSHYLPHCHFLLVQCRETKEEFIGLIINSELYLNKINAEICFKRKRYVTEIDFTAEHKRFYFFILSFSHAPLFVSLSCFCMVETSLWTGVYRSEQTDRQTKRDIHYVWLIYVLRILPLLCSTTCIRVSATKRFSFILFEN